MDIKRDLGIFIDIQAHPWTLVEEDIHAYPFLHTDFNWFPLYSWMPMYINEYQLMSMHFH